MIYLITGTPGTGKTALVVDMILNNYNGLFKMTADDGTQIDRPLYFCHIDGLDAKKFKAHELTETEIQSAPLNEIVPEGSVLIVDECDYTYPVRSSAKEVPPYIRTLKELRHEGFTLILLTQHPAMIDKYIRQLISKHIHLERKQVGTKMYEWFRCEENLNLTSFAQSASKFYRPPKKAFQYYKSANKHIQFKKSRHIIFYIFPLIVFYVAYGVFNFWNKFNQDPVVQQEQTQQHQEQQQEYTQNNTQQQYQETTNEHAIDDYSINNQDTAIAGIKPSDYEPRIPDRPETKPIYDNLRNVVNMEQIVGCIASADSCNCYSQQSTRIIVSDQVCRHYANEGIFDLYGVQQTNQIQQFTEANQL